jgi:hypothetical protein
MPGLFDILDSEDGRLGLALLAAAGPSMQPTSIGQRIAGAVQSVGSQRDSDLRRKLIQSQIGENDNQNLYRSAQVADLQRKGSLLQAFADRMNGGGTGGVGVGGTTARSSGGGTGAATASSGSGAGAGAFPLSPTDLAMAKIAGLPDLADIYKLTEPNWVNVNGNLVNTKAPGFTGGVQDGISVSNDGRATMWRRKPDGSVVMGAPEGAIETYRAFQDVGNRSQASYTPGRPTILPGGRMGGQSQLQEIGGAPPSPFGDLPQAQAGVTGNFIGNPAAVSAAIASIRDPQERANALAAFELQMRSPGSTRETPGGGLEFSPREKEQQDADRARAVKTAEADVVRDTAAQADVKTARKFLDVAKRARAVFNEGPTDSGIGSAVDRVAALGGYATPGSVAAQRLKALGGWLVSNVPRMEGPQSNFDVANYQVMAADVANDTLPLERRRAALDSITQMMEDIAGTKRGMAAERTVAAPAEQPPVARLKTAPSDADLRNTALKYGMTVDQVKQRLGIK